MLILIVIWAVLLGLALALVRRRRHRIDPMRARELAFATLRRMAESPRVQMTEMQQRAAVESGHVRILSERPVGIPHARRGTPTRRAGSRTQRRRTLTPAHPTLAVIAAPLGVTSTTRSVAPVAPLLSDQEGSGSRRRAGGSLDAIGAAIERAVEHSTGMTDPAPTMDEPTARPIGVVAKSA